MKFRLAFFFFISISITSPTCWSHQYLEINFSNNYSAKNIAFKYYQSLVEVKANVETMLEVTQKMIMYADEGSKYEWDDIFQQNKYKSLAILDKSGQLNMSLFIKNRVLISIKNDDNQVLHTIQIPDLDDINVKFQTNILTKEAIDEAMLNLNRFKKVVNEISNSMTLPYSKQITTQPEYEHSFKVSSFEDNNLILWPLSDFLYNANRYIDGLLDYAEKAKAVLNHRSKLGEINDKFLRKQSSFIEFLVNNKVFNDIKLFENNHFTLRLKDSSLSYQYKKLSLQQLTSILDLESSVKNYDSLVKIDNVVLKLIVFGGSR